MFFSPRKECSGHGETRRNRKKKLFSFDSPGSLRDLSSASLMCFSSVMVANVSHGEHTDVEVAASARETKGGEVTVGIRTWPKRPDRHLLQRHTRLRTARPAHAEAVTPLTSSS